MEEYKKVTISFTKDQLEKLDEIMSKEKDGSINEDYCKWCYKDGNFTYNDMESLISFCENTMSNESFTRAQVRDYMSNLLPKLKHWSAE